MGSNPQTEIQGENGSVTVNGLTEDQLDDSTYEQLQAAADSTSFLGNVEVMPDCHYGAGATIGFTMDIDTDPVRVCPNSVGKDIGCGLLASQVNADEIGDLDNVDDVIRNTIPMGRSVHDRNDYHIGNQFPWDSCDRAWKEAKKNLGLEDPEWFDGYGLNPYFKDLCERITYDPQRAINSVGTLGGGNHFIELSEDTDNPEKNWFIIHSGSRGIGGQIASYWQNRATRFRTNDWIRDNLHKALEPFVVPDLDSPELSLWFNGGKNKSYIDDEAIREAVNDNYLVGYLFDEVRKAHPDRRDENTDFDYLEGQEVAGYLVDMIFAQRYAEVNRFEMMFTIFDVLDYTELQRIHTPHNLVDFDDLVLRKGAVRATDGHHFILPFNMADGTYICVGKGNEDWNNSCAHGAGRVMSRTQAFDELDMDNFENEMEDIYSSSVTEETLDEAPPAYKEADLIADAIEPTAELKTKLTPRLNIKALE